MPIVTVIYGIVSSLLGNFFERIKSKYGRIALIIAFAGLSLIVGILNQQSQQRDNEKLVEKLESVLDRRFSHFGNQILTQLQNEKVLSKDLSESIHVNLGKAKADAITEIRGIITDPGQGGEDPGASGDPVKQ